MQNPSRLKIVEIGSLPFVKQTIPDQVAFFSTWPNEIDHSRKNDDGSLDRLTLAGLWRALHDPETSLVVCHPTFFSPWHWRWIARVLFDRRALPRVLSLPRRMGPQLLRRPIAVPIVVYDAEDLPVINQNNFFLLDRCRFYFKRELPVDRWQTFLKTGHSNLPTPRFRSSERYRARIEKLRPISLGLPLTMPRPFAVPSVPKSTDIFFAGRIDGSSSVRPKGLQQLLALRERGYVIDFVEARLSQDEFYRRCARAWLTWSPEGLGWDCFRHYEAAACGSVPLINHPTIERYQPLQEGEHAVYYDVEENALMHATIAALADKPRLEAMACAAQAHVLTHHTPEAIARHIVHTSLNHV